MRNPNTTLLACAVISCDVYLPDAYGEIADLLASRASGTMTAFANLL